MKKIITLLILFVATLFVADRVIYYCINFFYCRTFTGQDGGDINKYLQDKNAPPLVIMGSSTTRFQVNPDSFSLRTCNLAHHSTTIHFQLALLNLMVQQGHVPKNILLAVSPNDYVDTTNSTLPNKDILFLKYYYDRSDYIRTEINKFSKLESTKFWFASYKFNGIVINTFRYYMLTKQQHNNNYYFAYQRPGSNDSLVVTNELALHKQARPPVYGNLVEAQTDCLLSFINTCKKNNIHLMCYYMPMLMDDSIPLKGATGFLDSTMSANQLPYYKFTPQNIPVLYNNPSYWCDLEHMNEKGGSIESHILAEFVRQNAQ